MTYVHSAVNQGFGETIRKINGAAECNGQNREQVQDRVRRYTDYCKKFGVDPGPKLECWLDILSKRRYILYHYKPELFQTIFFVW